MSAGLSSDQIIKYEITEKVKSLDNIELRIFPDGSNQDQLLVESGGLTFSYDGVDYGSCDAGWFIVDNKTNEFGAIIGLEGTDALNRGSAGDAQYQRFHHALGAVKNGIFGIYYLRKGKNKMQLDLLEMAYNATKYENSGGYYLIIQDLNIINELLSLIHKYGFKSEEVKKFANEYVLNMHMKWVDEKFSKYNYDMSIFAKKRSTIIKDDAVIKYTGRMKRNFTDSSQRAGHIAVGEMYLTKYLFYGKKIYYLCPRMTTDDVIYLDENKSSDKEWYLLRHEKNVYYKTRDDLKGLKNETVLKLQSIQNEPLKSGSKAKKIYDECINEIVDGIEKNEIIVV